MDRGPLNIRQFDLQIATPYPRLESCFLTRDVPRWKKLLPLIILLAVMPGIMGIYVFAVRWARKSARRAAFLGWGLQFLGAGVNPVRPPQVQLEKVYQQARIRKDAESGDSKE
jgi:hypothetical protein